MCKERRERVGGCLHDSNHCQEPNLESSKIREDSGRDKDRLELCLLQCSVSHITSSGDLLIGSMTLI